MKKRLLRDTRGAISILGKASYRLFFLQSNIIQKGFFLPYIGKCNPYNLFIRVNLPTGKKI